MSGVRLPRGVKAYIVVIAATFVAVTVFMLSCAGAIDSGLTYDSETSAKSFYLAWTEPTSLKTDFSLVEKQEIDELYSSGTPRSVKTFALVARQKVTLCGVRMTVKENAGVKLTVYAFAEKDDENDDETDETKETEAGRIEFASVTLGASQTELSVTFPDIPLVSGEFIVLSFSSVMSLEYIATDCKEN